MNIAAIMEKSSRQSDTTGSCDIELKCLQTAGRGNRPGEKFLVILLTLDGHVADATQDFAEFGDCQFRIFQVAAGPARIHYIEQRPSTLYTFDQGRQGDFGAVMAGPDRRRRRQAVAESIGRAARDAVVMQLA